MSTRYTPEQVAFIKDARHVRGVEYRALALEFAAKFGVAATPEQMRHIIRNRGDENPALPQRTVAANESTTPHPHADFVRASFTDPAPIAGDGIYFVTAATPVTSMSLWDEITDTEQAIGRNVATQFLGAIKKFTEEFSAQAIVLPMRAHIPALRAQPSHYDPVLRKAAREGWLRMAGEVPLNENLTAMDLYLNPQQGEPLRGLNDVRGRAHGFNDGDRWVAVPGNASLFVAHTKQDMEMLATGAGSIPRMIHTTGAVTVPEYLKNRVGRIAADAHVIGGLVVIVRGDLFWVQAVQAHPVDGSFCVGPWRVSADGVTQAEVEAVKLGDLHPGHDDGDALKFEKITLNTLFPRILVAEDWLDGQSISHHLEGRHLQKAQARSAPQFATLANEFACARDRLNQLIYWGRVDCHRILTYSNHPEHVRRWLDEARYINDPVNYEIGHRMIIDILEGRDPVLARAVPPGWRMLSNSEELFVEGMQYAMHGHLGVNGARGTPAGLRRHLSSGVSAHSHTPSKRGRWLTAGHSSSDRHGYNEGPSTWMVAHVATYVGGQSSHVMRIGGSSLLQELPEPYSIAAAKKGA